MKAKWYILGVLALVGGVVAYNLYRKSKYKAEKDKAKVRLTQQMK